MATFFIVLFIMAIVPASWQRWIWDMAFGRFWPQSALKHNVDLAINGLKTARSKIKEKVSNNEETKEGDQ